MDFADFYGEEKKYQPLEPSTYEATVSDLTMKLDDKERQVVSAEFTVMGESYGNRKIWERYWLTPKAMWKFGNFMKAVGEDSVKDQDSLENAMRRTKGKVVLLKVGLETYPKSDGTTGEKNTGDVVGLADPGQSSVDAETDVPF